MHIKRRLVLPVAAIAFAIGSAHAANEQQLRNLPNFNQMDKNSDGVLTRAEAAAHPHLSANFDQVDTNNDGVVSRGEYLAVMAQRDLDKLRDEVAGLTGADDEQASEGRTARGDAPGAASPQMVRNVQQKLKEAGVNPGPIDGIWGPRTHQAVREFQKREGLPTSGQLNTQTLSALGIAGESASPGS